MASTGVPVPQNVKVHFDTGPGEYVMQITWLSVSGASDYIVKVDVNDQNVYNKYQHSLGPKYWQQRHEIYQFEAALFGSIESAPVYRMKVSIVTIVGSDQSSPGIAQVDYIKSTAIVGKDSGNYFDDAFEVEDVRAKNPPIAGIKELTIFHGDKIDSLQAVYSLEKGGTVVGQKHGGGGGVKASFTLDLENTETIKEVIATKGYYGDLEQLTFITSFDNKHGPYGKETPKSKKISLTGNRSVIGLRGRSGALIDAIGFYIYSVEPYD